MKIPVLIIGAGPTGLMMAAQLARFGVDFRIVERNAFPSEKTKAIAVQARTLEIYEQMNLIDEVLEGGLKFKTTHIIGNGVVKANIQIGDFGKDQSPYPFIQIFTQDKNERLLISYLEKFNKSVEWSKEYSDLKEVENGVEVKVKSSDGTIETIVADYVVACDGGKSPVRHSLKIPFKGDTYEQVFFVADTAVDWKYGYGDLFLCMGKNKFAAFFPMPGEKRFRVVSIIPEKFLGKAETTFDDIKKIITDELNIKAEFYDTSWFAEYRIHHRVVSTFSKGRIFLAGDAAHIHSPAGGQGMNTGLQDAYNLAWKLASVLKHNANKNLLDTYNEERLPNAIRLVNTTDRAFTFIINANPFLRANVIPVIAKFAIRIPFIKKFMFKGISQIGITYEKFSLARGTNSKIKAGQRLPYTELFLNKDDVNIYTLLKAPSFHILICQKEKVDDEKIKSLSSSLAKIIPDFIKVIVIDPLQTYPQECWGIRTNSIIIVRPDNYIGCIVNEINPIAIGFEKVKRWFEEKIL
ncbi:MAG: FAD-dependent monooxygenase [Bacteroidia bacterium]